MKGFHKNRFEELTRKPIFVILLYILKICEATDYQCLNCEDFNRQSVLNCAHQIIECADYILRNNPDELAPPKSVGEVEGQLIDSSFVWEENGHRNLNLIDTEQWQDRWRTTFSTTKSIKSAYISCILKDTEKCLAETKTKKAEAQNLLETLFLLFIIISCLFSPHKTRKIKLGIISQPTAIFFLCFLKLCSTQETPDCLNCEDFNRQNLVKCPLHLTQCGECVPGNIPDELDPRICFALEIVITPPKLIEGDRGHLIELPCEFNSNVECVWERNGQHVAIDDSHRYLFKNKDVNEVTPTEDCSLIIEDLNPIDVGEWQCGSRATSSTISVKSALISVILKESTTTTKTMPKKSQETEISENTNTMHLYLGEEIVDRRVTTMLRIMNESELECRTEVVVDELRWEIESQSIVNISNANSVQIRREDIERYFMERDWPFAKVYCVAVHTGYKQFNSYVFITNQRTFKTTTKMNEGRIYLSRAATITIGILITCSLIFSLALGLYCCWKKKLWKKCGQAASTEKQSPSQTESETTLL